MSLWDDITKVFSSSGSGGGSTSSLLTAGLSLGSALLTSRANREAAERAEAARVDAARRIERSNAQAISRYDALAAETQPGLNRLRDVAVGADGLTATQRAELDRLRRSTLSAVTAGGLGGSGRATTAALRDVESDYINKALDFNSRRADDAAGTLARVNVGARSDAANVGRDTGLRTAGLGVESGDIAAEAGLANAALRGAALGDIAGVIASDAKGRESRHQKRSGDDQDEERI